MIPSADSRDQKTLQARPTKSSGWAAFDLDHRRKNGLLVQQPQLQSDPFPSIPTSTRSVFSANASLVNNTHSSSPFSSLLSHSSTLDAKEHGESSRIADEKNKIEQDCHVLSLRKLKEIHKWADDSLLEDVLSAVGNDVKEASTLLKGMAPYSSIQENKVTNELEAEADASLGKTYDLCVLGSTLQDCLDGDKKKMVEEPASGEKTLHNKSMDAKLILGRLKTIPVEPEWEEEDDVYLSHRKDALKMMRSAAQHSKAATNAFSRGDHSSARQLSLKAQEEWLAAETLNAKASREILSIRNRNNDIWKLDLHGLHATEAIQVLMEHLCKIENQLQENNSGRCNRNASVNLCDSSGSLFVDKLAQHQAVTRHRSATLQVITGIGNHSRGEASLPTAVKNYLSENGYRFDEARPGVITVRPKLRLR